MCRISITLLWGLSRAIDGYMVAFSFLVDGMSSCKQSKNWPCFVDCTSSCEQNKDYHYFVDGTSKGKQSNDRDKCLDKANMYEMDMLAKRMIIINVLIEMISRVNTFSCIWTIYSHTLAPAINYLLTKWWTYAYFLHL
jgi:hypothetical protein